ncbi:MAG: FG-GAP repeat domain-containing protein [Acidobacteriota bacterium]
MTDRLVFLLFITIGLLAADLQWTHLSSREGDLPKPGPSPQQTASLILDVDQDSLNDFIIASRVTGPSVLWYRRHASGWTKYVIDPDFLPIEAGGASHDIDRDGDVDIVFGGDAGSNQIWWWENPHPDFDTATPWRRHLIKDSGGNKHHDQLFGDFDGDGKAELASWNQFGQTLLLFEIPSEPKVISEWPSVAIYTWSEQKQLEGLAATDINEDGKLDIVGGGRWFEHLEASTFKHHVIDDSYGFSRAAAGQLKAGGRPEVVFVPGDLDGRAKWFEWTGQEWIGHDLLGFEVIHGHTLQLADFNSDGNLDIFCAEMGRWRSRAETPDNPNARMWIFLGDGQGNFDTTIVARGFGNHESKAGDLDGDGDVDILGKPYHWETPRVDVWLNGR